MNTKRTALAAAATGVLAGVVGLGVLAMPADANEVPPALPQTSAESLVESVVTAKIPAMDGKIEASENLGLPMKVLPEGVSGATVATDGDGRVKASLPGKYSEKTIVDDGTTLWSWDSSTKTVTKTPLDKKTGPDAGTHQLPDGTAVDPATLAKDLVARARQYSDVQVDGTATVAGRPAYQLVLTPKPTERTLLREVQVAVDAETRIPLRVEVLANGQADPALNVGFTELNIRPQNPSEFTFTPPAGAKITEGKGHESFGGGAAPGGGMTDLFEQLSPRIVGEGWDTVAVVKLPDGIGGALGGAGTATGPRGGNANALSLLSQFGKEVDTPAGKAWVFTTKMATAMVTADGRAAVGAVPQQVLVDAIGQAK